jgi:hypothetical protein
MAVDHPGSKLEDTPTYRCPAITTTLSSRTRIPNKIKDNSTLLRLDHSGEPAGWRRGMRLSFSSSCPSPPRRTRDLEEKKENRSKLIVAKFCVDTAKQYSYCEQFVGGLSAYNTYQPAVSSRQPPLPRKVVCSIISITPWHDKGGELEAKPQ